MPFISAFQKKWDLKPFIVYWIYTAVIKPILSMMKGDRLYSQSKEIYWCNKHLKPISAKSALDQFDFDSGE